MRKGICQTVKIFPACSCNKNAGLKGRARLRGVYGRRRRGLCGPSNTACLPALLVANVPILKKVN